MSDKYSYKKLILMALIFYSFSQLAKKININS